MVQAVIPAGAVLFAKKDKVDDHVTEYWSHTNCQQAD